ncbi:DUF1294 domain-containing protein [Microbacterium sp. NPDC076911]|uniref:DUF1294 domain-containing protein n=1 Tax=Microbacterium sp. NPDC076911 TaxID=3154958 RepID=UPI00344136D1
MTRPLPAGLSWTTLIVFAATLGVSYVALALPWWLPVVYVAMSIVTFVSYGIDKAAAPRARRRVSERTLLVLGLLAGWPGALLAQQLFRHKTRKRSFRRKFWLSIVVNVVALVILVFLLSPVIR